jgi:uncharacterized protein
MDGSPRRSDSHIRFPGRSSTTAKYSTRVFGFLESQIFESVCGWFIPIKRFAENSIASLNSGAALYEVRSMKFDWDENKASRNLSKHGVSFEEAKTVFTDALYVDFYDPDHSDDEERYLIVGESNRERLLIVSYTERGDLIRLISAREVTRSEREVYEEG